MSYEIAEKVLLYLVVVICGASDLVTGKIYNHITYPAAGLGLLLALVSGGWIELGWHAAGLAIGFVPFFIVFIFRGMGGGDVKLMGAVGAIMGYPLILAGLFHTILVGGVIAVAVMVWKKTLLRGVRNALWTVVSWALPMETQPLDPANSQKVPFGLAIAAGAIWASLESLQLFRFDL